MHDLLKAIIETKKEEVAALKKAGLPARFPSRKKSFKTAIDDHKLSIIGEIKRRSPSKGELSAIKDPIALLKHYIAGGVSAISVLTDQRYFGGSADDLQAVVAYLADSHIPVLRKDFIIDPIQIDESVLLGANAILLIVAVLQEKTADLLDYAKSCDLDVIVEVHNQQELEIAIESGADLIGVNNRNLEDLSENLMKSIELRPFIPDNIITISESAIRSLQDIQCIKKAGFHAALIGEGLVKSSDPVQFLRSMSEIT